MTLLREPGEPHVYLHPIQHYKWAQPVDRFEWFSIYVVPTPLWRFWFNIRHPRMYYREWKRYHSRPPIGGFLMYHDEGPYRVVNRDGDDMVIEMPNGNATVSWSACCDPVPKP